MKKINLVALILWIFLVSSCSMFWDSTKKSSTSTWSVVKSSTWSVKKTWTGSSKKPKVKSTDDIILPWQTKSHKQLIYEKYDEYKKLSEVERKNYNCEIFKWLPQFQPLESTSRFDSCMKFKTDWKFKSISKRHKK